MSAWIELDGVRSTTFTGVIVTDVTPFLLAKKKATRTTVSGRLGQVDNGEPTVETAEMSFTLAVIGTSRTDAISKARALSKWLNGTKLRTYLEPEKYCTGMCESEITASKQNIRVLQVACKFTANPGCMYKGFDPAMTSPIPEQITAQNCTTSGSFTSSGRLTAMTDNGTYSPALHFKVTGTWTQLSIGDLVITQAFTASDPVYIDCENQVIYHYDGASKASVAISGSFPTNDAQGIQIGGTSIDVTVLAVLIERW